MFPEDGGWYLRTVDSTREVENGPHVNVEAGWILVVMAAVQQDLGVGLCKVERIVRREWTGI